MAKLSQKKWLTFVNVFVFSFVTAERLDNTDIVHSNGTFSVTPQEVPAMMEKHSKKKKKNHSENTFLIILQLLFCVTVSPHLLNV